MNKVCLQLVLAIVLCSYIAAEKHQVTITIGDEVLNDEKPKNLVSDLGAMLRNMFSFTNKLRSDIRKETGFKKAVHHSVHTSAQECKKCAGHNKNCACGGEHILEKVFDRFPSKKKAVPLKKLQKKEPPSPCRAKTRPCSKKTKVESPKPLHVIKERVRMSFPYNVIKGRKLLPTGTLKFVKFFDE